jgi:4-hydroxybenzoate polyprenyltransferase
LSVLLIGGAFASAGTGPAAWIALAAFALHLAWQVGRIDIDDPALCLRLFKANRDAGLVLFAGLLLDAALRHAA